MSRGAIPLSCRARTSPVPLPSSLSSGQHCAALTAIHAQLLYASSAVKRGSGFLSCPSLKLPPYSFQSQHQCPRPGDPCDNSATQVPSFQCLATSNSLGFSQCTVRSVNLPSSGLFSQEVPGCSETPPSTGFSACEPPVSILVLTSRRGCHGQQEPNSRRAQPGPNVEEQSSAQLQCTGVTHISSTPQCLQCLY